MGYHGTALFYIIDFFFSGYYCWTWKWIGKTSGY